MLAQIVRRMSNALGISVSPTVDMGEDFQRLYRRCRRYSMTSIERMFALHEATNYISDHRIPGDIVECGVWRGGSMMLTALTLLQRGDTGRAIYLYDTFTGNTAPSDRDVDWRGKPAPTSSVFRASRADVEANVSSTGYPTERFRFCEGPVESTIPNIIPERIALLRLDTDWYDSTAHELNHLFPRLVSGGVIIIDDFGHWQGARAAVVKYLREHRVPLLLNRIDYTGRIGIKM